MFPEDRPLPQDAVDSIQVKLSGLELRHPRPFGNYWLTSELWHQLGLCEFWRERLPQGRETASGDKVLRLLVVNRLLEPGSDFRVHLVPNRRVRPGPDKCTRRPSLADLCYSDRCWRGSP